MKKLNLFTLMVAIILLNACGVGSQEPTPSQIAKEQATIILDCFKTSETEKLKSLFCEEVQNSHDLDKEIEEAIGFIGDPRKFCVKVNKSKPFRQDLR